MLDVAVLIPSSVVHCCYWQQLIVTESSSTPNDLHFAETENVVYVVYERSPGVCHCHYCEHACACVPVCLCASVCISRLTTNRHTNSCTSHQDQNTQKVNNEFLIFNWTQNSVRILDNNVLFKQRINTYFTRNNGKVQTSARLWQEARIWRVWAWR